MVKILPSRSGQMGLDYVFLIAIAAAGITAIIFYAGRGHQGHLRSQGDQLSINQYDPGNTTVNNSIGKTHLSIQSSYSNTTVKKGNMSQPNTALNAVLASIVAKWVEIYDLRHQLELLFVPEATTGAAEFRAGNFGWTAPYGGTPEKYEKLSKAFDDLNDLYDQIPALEEAWKKSRTKDHTTTGSSGDENGTNNLHKEISEKMGNL